VTGRRSASGQPVIVARVQDTGELAIDLSGQARLSDGPGGITAGPFREQQVVTLAPGQSGNLVFAQSKQLPGGSWRATVTLVSGVTTITAQSDIRFPGGSGASVWSRLSWLVWVLGAAAGILILVLTRRRRPPRTSAARRRSAPARRGLGFRRGSHVVGG
jgi:hypothetical protein